ncbi:MAG TPA: HDIG domain-containing protein [Candidatus Saccharimonadales bacterium]|nr:HDIG domain-containing protein [Candidatus Saccharimonadales bacterium]
MNFDLSALSVERIRSGALKDTLPELYDLEQIVENNLWHLEQNVFDHSIAALQALDEYTSKRFELRDENYALLRAAVLLHDIGKLKAFYVNTSGQTSAPSHAQMGRWLTTPILRRLGFTNDETAYVSNLIGDHILVCDLLELTVKTGRQEYIEILKAQRPHMWRELLLIAYADIQGCKGSAEVKKEIYARTSLINNNLE